MPVFQYKSILLHQLPEAKGWIIVGIKYDLKREILATLAASIGQELAESWADMAAQNLAGQPSAEID